MASLELWDGRRLRVGKIIGLGRNYASHAKEMAADVPTTPLFFLKPATSIVGDGGVIQLPPVSERVDWEAELGVVIGRKMRNTAADRALHHVLGYCVLIDVTARDLQEQAKRRGEPWSLSKGFDTFTPCSKVADAKTVKDPQALSLTLHVNGQVRQSASTADMVHPVAKALAYLSSVMTLERGDLVMTGTPEGVGAMRRGDQLDARIEGVGRLRVSVA